MADLSITDTHARNIKATPTAENLITTHLDIWTTAIEQKSSAGRGSSNKFSLYGIKKLRELILELAVRGKLVPQDSNDSSPQKALLESIEKKTSLIRSGLIKKSSTKKIIKEEHFFSYPDSWGTAKLEEIINVINGRAYKKTEMLSEGTPILRVGNLFTSNDWYYSDLDLDSDKYIDNGDLIYSWSASFGPFIWDGGKVIYHYHIWKMDIYSKNALDKRFSQLFLAAISERIKASGNGIAMIHMTKERMEKVIHPLPPLEEQQRIVAKVDELMSLCDALEAQTEARISAHQTLVETLLNALLLPQATANTASQSNVSLEPSFTNSFVKDWQRVAEHFDTLFTTAASIDTLKQTILQLAVMGKLVKQNPNDEPAAKLLERIAKEKVQQIKEGKIKKQKPLPAITDEEKPFELPNGWEWCRVNDLLYLKNGYAFKSKYFNLDSGAYILATPGNFYETGGFRHRGSKTKYYDGPVQEEFLLTEGDLIIPLTEQAPGLLGSAAFIPNDGNQYLHNQRLGKLTPYSESLSPAFVSLFFNSAFLRRELARTCTGTTVRHTSPDRVLQNLMPMLPLEEQVRIVAKVDELMALCDQLKARLADAQTTQLHLTDAIVEKAI
ncbi:restriction endonuclease subunit S [Shewanella baltica]|uniref:restriction endonuclease subunit S n=1 Tax=Shewanella baltica TaxID=62322 RepID=UPI0039AF348B